MLPSLRSVASPHSPGQPLRLAARATAFVPATGRLCYAKASCLRSALRPAAVSETLLFECSDEADEERVGAVGARFELGVRLSSDEKRMVDGFYDFH